ETAHARGRLGVPVDEPRYTLRRVSLSKEEEQGYYAGFANEGLWPLCHIVHTRPIFRPDDWAYYLEVNQKFADVVLDQIKDADSPLVLIQDYHFAPLSALIKAERPDARVAIFWHIPWPNLKACGICPSHRERLLRRLGISAEFIGVGVERIDYTKGLPERLAALQFFFETYPQYRERLVFVQLAAPSRSTINRYQEIQREVEESVREINQMFQTK